MADVKTFVCIHTGTLNPPLNQRKTFIGNKVSLNQKHKKRIKLQYIPMRTCVLWLSKVTAKQRRAIKYFLLLSHCIVSNQN